MLRMIQQKVDIFLDLSKLVYTEANFILSPRQETQAKSHRDCWGEVWRVYQSKETPQRQVEIFKPWAPV